MLLNYVLLIFVLFFWTNNFPQLGFYGDRTQTYFPLSIAIWRVLKDPISCAWKLSNRQIQSLINASALESVWGRYIILSFFLSFFLSLSLCLFFFFHSFIVLLF